MKDSQRRAMWAKRVYNKGIKSFVPNKTFEEMKFVPYSAEMAYRDGYVHYTEPKTKVYTVKKVKKKGAWGYDLQ